MIWLGMVSMASKDGGTSTEGAEAAVNHSSDLELMRAVARGDEQSCRSLVERLVNRVHRLTSYMAGARLDVDDLVQVALLKVIDGAATFRGESSIEAWADRIAVRVIYKHLKKSARRDELYSTYQTTDGPSPSLDDDVYRRQLYRRMAHHIDAMPLERRTAFLLHHLHGYSVAEIAAMTEAPINTVRDRLRVGRKEIRRRLVVDPAFVDWAKELSP
jgi:RNA polymerase sigma-70 factor (ECF subfamily)